MRERIEIEKYQSRKRQKIIKKIQELDYLSVFSSKFITVIIY